MNKITDQNCVFGVIKQQGSNEKEYKINRFGHICGVDKYTLETLSAPSRNS